MRTHLSAALPTEEHVGGDGLRVGELLPGLAGLGHRRRGVGFPPAGESGGKEKKKRESALAHTGQKEVPPPLFL